MEHSPYNVLYIEEIQYIFPRAYYLAISDCTIQYLASVCSNDFRENQYIVALQEIDGLSSIQAAWLSIAKGVFYVCSISPERIRRFI